MEVKTSKLAKKLPAQAKELECAGQPAFVDVPCNVVGAFFRFFVAVRHRNAETGDFHHLKIVQSIAERNRIFQAMASRADQLLDAFRFAAAFWKNVARYTVPADKIHVLEFFMVLAFFVLFTEYERLVHIIRTVEIFVHFRMREF